jgi:hypothetical protein
VNTNRAYAGAAHVDYVSNGNAYLIDACNNVVYGVGEGDSEHHNEPGDEFRMVGSAEPPPAFGCKGCKGAKIPSTDFRICREGQASINAELGAWHFYFYFFDTLVLGRRGVSKREEYIFGSVTTSLIRGAADICVWVGA